VLKETVAFRLAFPHDNHAPAEAFEGGDTRTVPFDVPRELRYPVVLSGGRRTRSLAGGVRMPEATVDKDRKSGFA